jgi:hypothetical protein
MNSNYSNQNQPAMPLKDSLLRLSVSPIKADREAIARLERETGKDIQKIIQELDSIDITLKAIDVTSPLERSHLKRLRWACFCASVVGISSLFLLSGDQLPLAIGLGFMLGVCWPVTKLGARG